MTYRIIIIDEDTEELVRNQEVVDSEEIEQIEKILDEGVIETHDECEEVCDVVSTMIMEAGRSDVNLNDHDEMISVLEDMILVNKEE